MSFVIYSAFSSFHSKFTAAWFMVSNKIRKQSPWKKSGCTTISALPGGISGGKFSERGPLNTHRSVGGRISRIEGEEKGEVFWCCPLQRGKVPSTCRLRVWVQFRVPFDWSCFNQLDDSGHPEIYSNKTTAQTKTKLILSRQDFSSISLVIMLLAKALLAKFPMNAKGNVAELKYFEKSCLRLQNSGIYFTSSQAFDLQCCFCWGALMGRDE